MNIQKVLNECLSLICISCTFEFKFMFTIMLQVMYQNMTGKKELLYVL